MAKKKKRRKAGESPVGKKGYRGGGGRKPISLDLPKSHNTAIRLLNDLNEKRISPRDLSANQRRACLVVAADGKRPSHELAALFQVSPGTIRKDMQLIRKRMGSEVMEWSLEEVVGGLAMAKERCVSGALKQDDFGLAWTVEKEFAKLLLDTGVVKKRDQAEGFELTLKAVGGRYEEAVKVLAGGRLDPLITGVVQAKGTPAGKQTKSSTLALPLGEVSDAPREIIDLEPERVRSRRVDEEDWPELEPE